MEYYSVDKFNRGFNMSGGGVDESLEKLQKNIDDALDRTYIKVKNYLSRKTKALAARLEYIENVGKLYSVTDTYFSTKGRRIVTVSPAKDKTDVIIKQQLDEAVEKLEKMISDHIAVFENYKSNVNQEPKGPSIPTNANKKDSTS